MTINNVKPGNQKIEIGKDGNELKKKNNNSLWSFNLERSNGSRKLWRNTIKYKSKKIFARLNKRV